MITPGYLQRMARYNRWQNESIYGAADSLSDADRRLDRGSFFQSIHATLSHILWADELWMSRLSDWTAPEGPSREVPLYDDWGDLKQRRAAADQRFLDWSAEIHQADIDGDLEWYSGSLKRGMTSPRAVCMMQVFNHQTHHRGQVHAMLTAAGAKPEDTDIPFMPDAYL
ncbi:MAG: DinB family protein [Hyphomonadaceae bacterium]|nr:DinB family protein [Hyphomonadaceae bacterium]